MYKKSDIKNALAAMQIDPQGTLLIHSSMKAIGPVENGADAVLDACIEYMQEGLLIFPTHTWSKNNLPDNIYNPRTEPSCVGILTNLFLQRDGVVRSLHPTHSVAAIGDDAAAYVAGEEHTHTPCPRAGCWGKLYDRRAQILFMGSPPKRNTYIHSVEERNNIPNRLADNPRQIKIVMPDGQLLDYTLYGHHSPVDDISENYGKLLPALLARGIARKGQIGDAESYVCDAAGMDSLTTEFLQRNPDLFLDGEPIPVAWYSA